jgi:hypothetical protein
MDHMSEPVPPCGARFFDKVKQDLGRAVQVTTRIREGSTLTVVDVVGAEPGLARALTLLDRSRLRIHCEDAARTCYVFTWASGYGNGQDVRIQGMLEPRTGREMEGWMPRPVAPPPQPRPEKRPVPSWNPYPKRGW